MFGLSLQIMVKKDINTREDIKVLVSTFYDKVRAEETLGPFFTTKIKNWEVHINHLTTFWESSLFITRPLKNRYKGNPITIHNKVDKENGHGITELHFGIWLNLWVQTVNELYEGEYAENAKRRVRKMGSFLYLKLFEARTQ